MPRYFFHMDGSQPHIDDVGQELANDDCAWEAAVQILRDLESGFHPNDELRIEICRDRRPIFTVNLGARRIRRKTGPVASLSIPEHQNG